MPTIAYHTLGCKVNQYDTQAMEEILEKAGFQTVPFSDRADVYLINTCTVTGTGDKKSLQMVRRFRRLYPESRIVLCGCMAQLYGEELLAGTGADLIIGTQHRTAVAELLQKVIDSGKPVCAVEPMPDHLCFEGLTVSRQNERTRAVVKIQEGCDNRCTYCIIPRVRGPIRSRPLEDIRKEIRRLSDSGFCEIVLTGIHLTSYGRDLDRSVNLNDVVDAVQQQDGIIRVRLGSLEPVVVTPEFAGRLRNDSKICPQFHLALQSGSDSVLRRMKRRYNTSQYLKAVDNIREVFPHAAITTDILTGFPGETDEEFRETAGMIEKVGFSRIHVFPYSSRPFTPAAEMPGQLTETEKQRRCRELIAVGEKTALAYSRSWVGQAAELIPEEKVKDAWEGYTPEYLRVRLRPEDECIGGHPVRIRINTAEQPVLTGEKIEKEGKKENG